MLNSLFLVSYIRVNKWLQKNEVEYYPASVGAAYKEVFKRDAFACLAFFDKNNTHYYIYFNAAYNRDINRMVFTSISVVKRENLNTKTNTLEFKQHIEDSKDVKSFLKLMEVYL